MTASLALALVLSAAPGPAVTLAPAAARPGDAVLVTVRGAAAEPRGKLAGRPLTFWRDGARYRALAALPLETPLGTATAELEIDGARRDATLTVVEPGFHSATLQVAPGFVEPPAEVKARIAEDRGAFSAAWDQPFAPPLFDQRFALPRGEGRASGQFGDQRVFNGKAESVHYGLDLRGRRGAPIKAANAGTVVLVRDAYMSGNSVVIWHGAGIFTIYFHMDRVDVHAGDRVRRGQRIGVVGTTGRSTGPHLHWGVKVDGLYVDPESLLAIDFRRGTAPSRVPAPRTTPPALVATPAPAPVPAGAPTGTPEPRGTAARP